VGVPPFTGLAVKLTEAPAQTVLPGFAVILTEGTTTGFTVMVMVFEVALVGDAHGAVDVIITLTTSLLLSVVVVKVEAVAPPTFVPFTCH
jgi:hypothetical protein